MSDYSIFSPCDLKCFLNLVAFVSTTSFQSLGLLGDFGKKSSTYDHPSPVGVRRFLSLQGRLQKQIIFLPHRYMKLKNEIQWVILKLKHPALARLQEQLWRFLRSGEGAWGHARVHHWTKSEGVKKSQDEVRQNMMELGTRLYRSFSRLSCLALEEQASRLSSASVLASRSRCMIMIMSLA